MITLTRDGFDCFRHSGSHLNGAAFEPIYMFPSLKEIRMVVVSAGTTTIQFTLSSVEEVKAGTANWYDEKSCTGTVSYKVPPPVTALRLTGNAATYEILAS